MHKLTKIFIVAALAFISTQSIYANDANPNYGGNPNYRQGQMSDDQSASNISGEDAFMIQSRNRSYMQYDRNNPYRNQGQMMRGNVGYPTNPPRYSNQGYDVGVPVSYPLEENYSSVPGGYRPQRYGAPSQRGFNVMPRNYSPAPDYGLGYNSSRSDRGRAQAQNSGWETTSTRMNRGAFRTRANTGWDMTDDQAIDPSSSNTRRSFTNRPNTQR